MTKRRRFETNKTSEEKRHAAKKAAVFETEKRSHLPLLGAVIIGALVVVFTAIWVFSGSGEGEKASVIASTDTIAYPVETFQDGKARHYEVNTGQGAPIKFFVLKSSDGVLRAAFDACDVCWKAGLGYYQDGDQMVCRNCGQRFASVKVNEVKGGCNPAPLERRVVDGQLVIEIKDLLEGKRFFDFAERS